MSGIRRRLLYAKPKEAPKYLTFTALESGTFTLTMAASMPVGYYNYAAYSLDEGKTWTSANNVNSELVTLTTPTVNEGDTVMWKGKGTRVYGMVSTAADNCICFSSTCRFTAKGFLASFCTEKPENETTTRMRSYGNIFNRCTTLVDASELILPEFTSAASAVFYGLFYGCTSLTAAPTLSSTTISIQCYGYMFYGCSSLETLPQLPATTLANNCYEYMFDGCISLTAAPALPATTLADYCYQYMFRNCTSLVTAPTLPATELQARCYTYMFYGCTALVNVPNINVISFTGSYSMSFMFANCTSLTHCPVKSVPDTLQMGSTSDLFYNCTNLLDICELPALTLTAYAYRNLIRSSKVNYIKMLATDISANGCLGSWVQGISATGIFVKNINATWTTTGVSGVPSGWTIIYYDPTDDKYYTDQTKATECDDHGNPLVNPNYKIVPMEIEIYGKYQNPSTNTLSDNASYCTTYYYEIEDFDSVAFFPEVSNAYSFVYDENYDRLGNVGNINNANIKTVYPTAKYVRFSGDTNNNMQNPFMVFYNTTNYVQSEYALPKTSNIKLFKPEIAIRGKYLPATGVETNMGNYSISEYYEIVADRFQPYLNRNRSYCHAYDANEEWLFNLGTNTSIKGRDANATYIRISEETARMETASYFGVMYNFENVI